MPWLSMASALLAAALWLPARRHFATARQPLWFCALLGFVLLAAAALAEGLGSEAALLLGQARDFLALALLGSVALALGRRWDWPGSVWGRVVLGLCLFFEVARQLQVLEAYRLLLGLLSVALVLYGALCRWPARRALLPGLTSAGLLGTALLAAQPWLAQAAGMAGYPLLALLLVQLSADEHG